MRNDEIVCDVRWCRPCWRDRQVAVPATGVLWLVGENDHNAANRVPVCSQHDSIEKTGRRA